MARRDVARRGREAAGVGAAHRLGVVGRPFVDLFVGRDDGVVSAASKEVSRKEARYE